MRNKFFLFLCLTGICCLPAAAQVRFRVNTGTALAQADALFTISAASSYPGPESGTVLVRVTEQGKGVPVVQVTLPGAVLQPGLNTLSAFRERAQPLYFENELSRIAQSTGTFAPGTYEVCCSFLPADKGQAPVPEQCAAGDVFPRALLLLVSPGDSTCNKRPPFIWRGRKAQPSVAYRVVCVTVGEGQTGAEALSAGVPVFDQLLYRNQNQMPFPAGSPALEAGKRYAWQVTEVAGGSILNSSEIFEFAYGCGSPGRKAPASYADVKTYHTGRSYYFTTTIDFAFSNPYVEAPLQYAIVHMATGKKLSHLPSIQMKRGVNQVQLPVRSLKGIREGEQYVMEVYGLSPSVQLFNFIIQRK
ncbi:MAG: hypothetical protein EOO16_08490 [Chitinophagaceae bacterium]|nr:MAG: hypothetical protein EOO16_08490 [Chitinophagaceae bacterium]